MTGVPPPGLPAEDRRAEPAGAGPNALTAPSPGPSRRRVIVAMGIGQVLVWGSSYYLPAVLAKPIADRTGWPLPWVIGALSLALVVSGLISPRVGDLIERHGGRPVLMGGAALMAAGLSLLAASPNLLVFIAGWLVLGAAMGAGLYDPAFATLGRLYGKEARAIITSLTLIGGFASTVCWPLSAFLLQHCGWRGTCLAYAGMNLLVVLPLYRFGLPAEQPRMLPPKQAGMRGGLAASDPNRHLLFWLVAVGMTLSSIIAAVMSVHLLTVLQQRGVALDTAVALGAIVGPCQVGARLIDLVAGQRTHPIWEALLSALFVVAGLGLLLTRQDAVVVALVIYGGGIGLRSIVRGTLPLALFGPNGYARLVGRLAFPMLAGQAAGPAVGAILLQRLGPGALLEALFWTAAATLLFSAALIPFARHRPAAAPRRDAPPPRISPDGTT